MSTEIERIIDELQLEWDPEARERFRVGGADIALWKHRTGLDETTVLDRIGLSLARWFHDGSLDFWFCNDLVNDVWRYLMASEHMQDGWPAVFCEVFYIFEAGEVSFDNVPDPVEFYVRPLIAKLLGWFN